MATKVMLKEVLIHYPSLTAKPADKDTPAKKATAVILVGKSQADNLASVHAAIASESIKLDAASDETIHVSFRDGGDPREDGTAHPPHFNSSMVLSVANKATPVVVDGTKAVIDASIVRPGDIVNVSLRSYGYRNFDRTGVAFELAGIQWLRKGESINPVINDFDIVTEAPF